MQPLYDKMRVATPDMVESPEIRAALFESFSTLRPLSLVQSLTYSRGMDLGIHVDYLGF
jgi:hypothetical protein